MTLKDTNLPFNDITHIRAARPWEDQIHEGIVTITPDLAARILADANYVGQRRVSESYVSVYTEMMRRGLWILADPIAFARFHGNLTLVNGQHRLRAIVAYGQPVAFRVAVNDCSTIEEVRSLYYRFDAVTQKRSDQQILSSMDLATEHNVSKTVAAATYRAIGVIVNDFITPSANTVKKEAISKLRVVDLRVEACEPWWPVAKRLEECFANAQKEIKPRLMRATTFAVALTTMRHQPERAAMFWRGVAENDGLKRTDVRHLFVRDLMSRDVSGGAHDQGVFSAAMAWNAWYEGRSISMIRIPENYRLRISGTPVGGKGD